MDKLIRWLLENIFVVVLLPIVLAWLKRFGQALVRQEGSPPNRQNRMPSFGGEWAERNSAGQQAGGRAKAEELRRAEAERQAGREEEKREEEGRRGRAAIGEPASEASALPAASERPTRAVSPFQDGAAGSGLPAPGRQPAAAPARYEGEDVLSPKDALRGIVWSEVLGPPRAKRPHRKW